MAHNRSRATYTCVPLAALSLACNSFDHPSALDPNAPVVVIPTDDRAPLSSSVTPPPVSGGTLLVTQDGKFAVASDPDRDRIAVVDLATAQVAAVLPLEPSDEPGRLVEDASGRVHVALRRGGAVVTLDLATQALIDRRPVCGAPRGIAFDAAMQALHVACAEGTLVTLPASGGAATRALTLEPDLRDVSVAGDHLLVSRFRAAELIELDVAGQIVKRDRPDAVSTTSFRIEERDGFSESVQESRNMAPSVAWRLGASSLPLGSDPASAEHVMLHQRGVEGEIPITEPNASGASSYGSGSSFSCDSIVHPALTRFSRDGRKVTSPPLAGVALAVDMAVSSDGRSVVVANAGPPDVAAPRPKVVFPGEDIRSTPDAALFGGLGSSLQQFSLDALSPSDGGQAVFDFQCAVAEGGVTLDAPVTAVAFDSTRGDRIVAQMREPSKLVIFPSGLFGEQLVVALGGESRADTGHDLFHRDSGAGIACASCHPEGREDGRVWSFEGFGARRTQALNAHLAATAPFHWDGELASVGALMTQVFVGRMGGVRQSGGRLATLENWLFALEPLSPIRSADDPAVARGQAVFESQATGCTNCHVGSELTNNQSFPVGTSADPTEAFQVPSLIGVAHRAPFLHTGCAPTLAARFDPACGGGELHGTTASLTASEQADLVAFLESL